MAFGTMLTGTSVNTGSPSKHASTAASDLMVAIVSCDGNGGTANFATVTGGWTRQAQQVNGTAAAVAVWTATGSASNPVFTTSGGTILKSQIITFPGGDTTNPFGAAGVTIGGSTGSSASPAYSAVTSSVRGASLLHAVASATTTIFSAIDFRELVVTNANSGGTTAANHEQLITVEHGYGESVSSTTGRTNPTAANAAWAQITGWVQPAAAATFGLVQSTRFQGTGSSGTATFPAALTSGTLLTVQAASFTNSLVANEVTSVTYGGGATALTQLIGRSTGNTAYAGIWYKANNTDTTAATVTANRGGSDSLTFLCCEWKGAATSSPQDASGGANGASTSPAATTTGSSAAGTELALSTTSNEANGVALTAPTTYVQHYIYILGSTGQQALGAAAREFAGGGTETATWTLGSSATWTAVVGTFKAAAAATTSLPPPRSPWRIWTRR